MGTNVVMLVCSVCPFRCLSARKWKHLLCTANPCPLPGWEAGLTLLAWPETQVWFIVWLQLQCSSVGLLDKCSQTLSATWITYYSFLRFLRPLSCHRCISLFLSWEKLHLTTCYSLVLVLLYPFLNSLFLTLLARLSQYYVLLWVWIPGTLAWQCPISWNVPSAPAICVVQLLLTSILLSHLRYPASSHSTICSFCQLLTIFPLTSTFPDVTSTFPDISCPLASTPFPSSSTSRPGPSWQPGACSAMPIAILQAAALWFACKWSICRLLIHLFDNTKLSCYWKSCFFKDIW